MKKKDFFLLGVLAAAAAGLAIYAFRRQQTNRRHAQISDEGYETAHDVLFPGMKARGRKLHYGPVIPK